MQFGSPILIFLALSITHGFIGNQIIECYLWVKMVFEMNQFVNLLFKLNLKSNKTMQFHTSVIKS